MTGNDWEARQQDDGTAGRRDYETTRLRDHGTTRLRDHETARPRDRETTRQRDNETTGRRDDGTARLRDYGTTGRRDNETPEKHRRSQAFSVVLSRSQAFSVVLSRAELCEAVRGCLVSEGCRVLHSAKMPSMGSTKAYVPLTAFFVRGRNRPLITPSLYWFITIRPRKSIATVSPDSKVYSAWIT